MTRVQRFYYFLLMYGVLIGLVPFILLCRIAKAFIEVAVDCIDEHVEIHEQYRRIERGIARAKT